MDPVLGRLITTITSLETVFVHNNEFFDLMLLERGDFDIYKTWALYRHN